MPDLRWCLKREGGEVALVCERRSDRRGYQIIVRDRHVAREHLRTLKQLVRAIALDPPLPSRVFDPVEEGA